MNDDKTTLFNEDPKYHSLWKQALPPLEHYIPLMYILSASDQNEKISISIRGNANGIFFDARRRNEFLILKVIRSKEHQKMNWKNGLGETSQIAIFPPGADLGQSDFLWRISSAKISRPNSFSNFDNHDRFLTVLSGGALELKTEGKEDVLLKPFSVHHFSGADKVSCERRGEEITDLGIIYNRKWIEASMKVENAKGQTVKLSGGTHFIVCLENDLFVGEMRLKYLDCIRSQDVTDLKLSSSDHESKFALIQILTRI